MRTFFLATLAAIFLAAPIACGGGTTEVPPPAPLNTYEAKLADAYILSTFELRPGNGIFGPGQYADWSGELVLREDRTGYVTVLVQEAPEAPVIEVNKPFLWKADSGLIELFAEAEGESDGIAEWEILSLVGLETIFFVPTNRPSTAPLLGARGTETFIWTRVP